MAKGDYYFPLFYRRLLTSTIGWKDDEFGAYLRLLIYQFDNGSIPSEMSELIRIAPSVKKHWPLISKKFKSNGNGGLINEVMNEIYMDVQDKKSTNSTNGKKGGRPKKENRIETEIKPNGFENKTETKAILITNNQKPIVEELGSDRVSKIANSVWKDEGWRHQLQMGLDIKSDLILKKWFAQFNSSISNDAIAGFDERTYKKMIRGWIVKQKEKGAVVTEETTQQDTSQMYRLKKI